MAERQAREPPSKFLREPNRSPRISPLPARLRLAWRPRQAATTSRRLPHRNRSVKRRRKLPAATAASAAMPPPIRRIGPRRAGKETSFRRPWPRAQSPARGSAAVPILRNASRSGKPSSSGWLSSWSSSAVPFVVVQQTAQFADLFGRGFASGERMHHELACRAFEHPLQHVPGDLPLGLLGGQDCFIDVCALGFVSPHRSFCCHDLQQLQDGRISKQLLLAQRFMDLTNRRRPARPKDVENLKFRSGRLLRGLFHAEHHTTKTFVVSTKIFVDAGKIYQPFSRFSMFWLLCRDNRLLGCRDSQGRSASQKDSRCEECQ